MGRTWHRCAHAGVCVWGSNLQFGIGCCAWPPRHRWGRLFAAIWVRNRWDQYVGASVCGSSFCLYVGVVQGWPTRWPHGRRQWVVVLALASHQRFGTNDERRQQLLALTTTSMHPKLKMRDRLSSITAAPLPVSTWSQTLTPKGSRARIHNTTMYPSPT